MLTHLLIGLALAGLDVAPTPTDSLVVPAGTLVPVRFLTPVASGTTPLGWTVEAQTMADLTAGKCVIVPAYTRLLGIVEESLPGWYFRRRGRLRVTFEEVATGTGAWASLTAVVEDLEWLPPRLTDSTGLIRAPEGSLGHALLHGAAPGVALTPVAGDIAAPVGLISAAVGLFHRGPRVQIRAGDEGTLRLTSPLARPPGAACRRSTALPDSVAPAGLAVDNLPARTRGGNGEPGDVVNLIVRGGEAGLHRAFAHADWVEASRGGLRRRMGAVGAVVLGKSYAHAPMSTQRLFERVEDLAFERQGANARARHHVWIWAVNANHTLWVGAASEDVGLHVTIVKPRVTHRMAPEVDGERDLMARELEAGGCARRRGFVRIPGAPLSGRNSSGEEFSTDGRATVVSVEECRPS